VKKNKKASSGGNLQWVDDEQERWDHAVLRETQKRKGLETDHGGRPDNEKSQVREEPKKTTDKSWRGGRQKEEESC